MPSERVLYPIVGVYMDAGRSVARLRPGMVSEATGIDGRYRDCAVPFPGFNNIVNLNTVVTGYVPANISFFQYIEVSVLEAGVPSTIRGFVIRQGADTDNQDVDFVYYAEGVWGQFTILTDEDITDTTRMSTTASGSYFYVAVEGLAPQTIYWVSGWGFQAVDMGAGDYLNPTLPTIVDSTTDGGLAELSAYGFAYRLLDINRMAYSGISAFTTHTTGAGIASVTFSSGDSGDILEADGWTHVVVYRTISVDVAGSSFAGGVLYEVSQYTLAEFVAGINVDSMVDSQRAAQTSGQYDPWADVAGIPPTSGIICNYQETLLMSRPLEDGGYGFQWSSTSSYDPENFSADNVYYGSSMDGPIQAFVEAGDAIYGFASNVIYRIQKTGSQLSIMRIHHGRSVAGPYAVHEVGRDAIMLSPMGLMILDGMTGDMPVVSSADRIMLDDWASSLGTVHSGFDSQMSASFFGNPITKTALVIWHTSKSISMLEDWDFEYMTTGRNPVTPGYLTALCLSGGLIYVPDAAGTGTGTMLGLPTGCTLNGTATSGSTTNVTMTSGTFVAAMVGSRVHMLTGANAGLSRAISNTSAHALTVAAFPHAVVAGDRFTVGPVPFRLVLWPIPPTDPAKGSFQRHVAVTAAVHAINYEGIASNVNAKWTLGMYSEGDDTPETAVGVVDMNDGDVQANYVKLGTMGVSGFTLQPFVEIISAGVRFELTDVLVSAKITDV